MGLREKLIADKSLARKVRIIWISKGRMVQTKRTESQVTDASRPWVCRGRQQLHFPVPFSSV